MANMINIIKNKDKKYDDFDLDKFNKIFDFMEERGNATLDLFSERCEQAIEKELSKQKEKALSPLIKSSHDNALAYDKRSQEFRDELDIMDENGLGKKQEDQYEKLFLDFIHTIRSMFSAITGRGFLPPRESDYDKRCRLHNCATSDAKKAERIRRNARAEGEQVLEKKGWIPDRKHPDILRQNDNIVNAYNIKKHLLNDFKPEVQNTLLLHLENGHVERAISSMIKAENAGELFKEGVAKKYTGHEVTAQQERTFMDMNGIKEGSSVTLNRNTPVKLPEPWKM